MKVVYIGADARTAEIALLAMRLRWPEVTPLVAATAGEGLELVEQESPDLVLLCPDFRDLTMSVTIQELRRSSNAPLLVLGYRGDDMEVVASLESGADDYVRIPCGLTELVVRIWALPRRAGAPASRQRGGPLSSGPLLVNPAPTKYFSGSSQLC